MSGASAEPTEPVDESGLTEKERDQLSMQSSAFDALERDFREVLNELVGDKSLDRFRLEYEKLHHTLKKSHENEKRLIKKCRELNQEIVVNAAKISTALRLSQQDHDSIKILRAEIDKAWKMVDGAQEKEKRARETIQRLKGEIQNLSRLVDQGAGLSIGQESHINDLLKIRDELTREVEMHVATIESNNNTIKQFDERCKELEKKLLEETKEVSSLKEKSSKLKSEVQREERNAKRLQNEMLTIKKANDGRKQDLQDERGRNSELEQKIKEMDVRNTKMRNTLDKYMLEKEELEGKVLEMDENQKRVSENVTMLKKKTEQQQVQIKKKDGEIDKKLQELSKEAKSKAKAMEDQEKLRKEKRDAEKYKNWLKDEMKNVLKSVEAQRKDAETDEKLIKELQQQIKRLTSSLKISADKNAVQDKLVEDHEAIKADLEKSILQHKDEEQKLRKRNYALEKQREKSAMDASSWYAKFQECQETIKLKEMEIVELQKNIQEEKNKLKLQQNLYEQVRSDRNLFSKQQVQSEDEIAEMKRKFKIMTHQIDQLKEEIQTKDAALINEHFAYKRLQDEMKVMKRKLAKRKEVLATADQVLASQDAEIKNLRRTLNDAERAQRQQKRVYDDVVQERDILGTQLIRRNDELALLYEKIRIQQSTLAKGEIQYGERVADIRALKLEINNTRRQLAVRQHEVTNIEALKNEVYHVQRELLQERTKVKALSEELENPMNVHRYRKLEGSDPKRYELIQKIQTLQKRLIVKTESVVEKDLLLQEKEKLYAELKNLLARQPGPEVAEQMSVYQHSLKEKTRQMKAMAAELNMFQAQVNEHRYELERVTRELQDVKRKYFEQRRKDQISKEVERADDQTNDPLVQQQQQFHATVPKITGGGFNLQAAAHVFTDGS
jgi:chromosome segregation ATPase